MPMLRRKRTFNGLGKLTNAVAVKQRQGGKACLIAAEHFGDIIDLAVAVEIADKNAVIGAAARRSGHIKWALGRLRRQTKGET